MDIKLPEREAYQLQRKIIEIRSRIQLLETELIYIPIANVGDFMERARIYSCEMEKLRLKCSEALTLLTSHQTTNRLPGM